MSQAMLSTRKPSKMDTGPFKVSDITDFVRGNLVTKQGVPITLEQKGRYAILAPPGKDLRIVCVGCFEPGMSLNDDRKCKKVSSYCQHWEGVKKGKFTCNAIGEDTLEACTGRLQSVGALADPVLDVAQGVKDLKDFSAEDLLQALKDKQELTVEVNDALLAGIPSSDLLYALKGTHPDGLAGYLDHIDIEDIVKYVQERDPKRLANKKESVVKDKVTRVSTRKRKANSKYDV
jgi:hypothetical protein